MKKLRTVFSLVALGLAGGLASIQAAALPDTGYRLSGIIAAGSDHVGFLALPSGGQVLIRKGSRIEGGGEVVEFTDRLVRISFSDGHKVELTLEGSGHGAEPVASRRAAPVGQATTVASAAAAKAPTPGTVFTGRRDGKRIVVRNVRSAALHAALAGPAAEPSSGDAALDVTHRFQPLLDLPAGAQIASVNEISIVSASQALREVDGALSRGEAVRLNLTSPEGDKRVYLLPDGVRR